jgi:hypothetical protein
MDNSFPPPGSNQPTSPRFNSRPPIVAWIAALTAFVLVEKLA